MLKWLFFFTFLHVFFRITHYNVDAHIKYVFLELHSMSLDVLYVRSVIVLKPVNILNLGQCTILK